jgi:hypothetical protein
MCVCWLVRFLIVDLLSSADVVLSSETLYSPEALPSFLAILNHTLSDTGRAWIAAKRFYFGTGGSTHAFTVAAKACGLQVVTERVFEDGVSNIRDVLRVERGSKS